MSYWCIICQDILYISRDTIVLVQLVKVTGSPPLSNLKGARAIQCYLMVREGRRAANFPKLCSLITQPFLKIYRHAMHQIKAEYHSSLVVSMILYNSGKVKLN